ncbi:MAG TPA: hypothetical protein VEX64_09295 [Pyrinomonadaceae bacterium]|jgi:hypothetical protein|nr:hypothetical protein [Pyrinomonadaceae bacterium]
MRNLVWHSQKLTNYLLFLVIIAVSFAAGCTWFSPKTIDKKAAVLLSPLEDAAKDKLLGEVNRLAEVKSIYGKVDVKFEDNTFAESGIAEKYKTADGIVTVQSPASINLRIQIPFVGTDIVQMTSDGDKFRVAVVCCVDEKFKRFLIGTNEADYTNLEKRAREEVGNGSAEKRAISAFSSLRPQHFTDALIMRPVGSGENFIYTQSEIYQEEAGSNAKSATPRVIRGYYLLDELSKNSDGSFTVSRRFWFDRVGSIRLARQQVFDEQGKLASDIFYGAEQKFGEAAQLNLPVQVQVTRPQERYSVKLTYQTPQAVIIGNSYDAPVFQLENKWGLPEVDLDKQVR